VKAPDLLTLLENRALEHGDEVLYTFLLDGEDARAQLGYRGLFDAARRIASLLEARLRPGDRAVLLFPPGLDYIAAFFGCIAARVVAVPAYPPDVGRLESSLSRLRAIIDDARPSAILTTRMIHDARSMVVDLAPDLAAIPWIPTDDGAGDADAWKRPDVRPSDFAFLQYTSGSTATPKGVILSHECLAANLFAIERAMRVRRGVSTVVAWLPPYHDMGLIGKILEPLWAGAPCTLMSPLDFLQRPYRWLRAIARQPNVVSGGPNFAYDLCVRRVTAEEKAGLDLGSWALAFSGAEPIRAETVERFAETFAPCGLRRAALFTCYGLAESTLMTTGASDPIIRRVDRPALESGRAVFTKDGHPIVSSGPAVAGMEIAIVDRGARCPDGVVGEIWLSGTSCAAGYWGRPDESEEAFRAELDGKSYLRTGDLGFLAAGELFVTGRIKDLIIIHGRKLHPHDIELTVEKSHGAIRPGCSAAVALEGRLEEGLAVVAEVDDRKPGTPPEILGAIRRGIADLHQVAIDRVVLVRGRSIPKTSSGKIQRHQVRAALSAGTLDVVASWQASEVSG
jgi:acyl-CoA synthetase (AMP-forming)/AMP-acid ligase II